MKKFLSLLMVTIIFVSALSLGTLNASAIRVGALDKTVEKVEQPSTKEEQSKKPSAKEESVETSRENVSSLTSDDFKDTVNVWHEDNDPVKSTVKDGFIDSLYNSFVSMLNKLRDFWDEGCSSAKLTNKMAKDAYEGGLQSMKQASDNAIDTYLKPKKK